MAIAIVGTGIAGLTAAADLAPEHDIKVFESASYIGGHSNTVDIDYDGVMLAVDTGFLVYNELTYPELTALFSRLGVATIESSMSFSVSADNGFEWAGRGDTLRETCTGLFARRRNMLSPTFLKMLSEIARFNRIARADIAAARVGNITLRAYLAQHKFSVRFEQDYLLPMAAAIWSMKPARILDFPARSLLQFLENHRLMQYSRPKWRTVKGGSRNYVEKLTAPFRGDVRLGCGVRSIERDPAGVTIATSDGTRERFEYVVIATHSDHALAMLSDATPRESAVLGAIPYASNRVFLHRDPALMPRRRRAWAAWNFLRWSPVTSTGGDVSVTYWLNELQGLDADRPIFVSLNPPFEPAHELTFAEFEYAHPQFGRDSFAAQEQLYQIQGRDRTWFCGAWTGYGFHEDGLKSGLSAARLLADHISGKENMLNAAAE